MVLRSVSFRAAVRVVFTGGRRGLSLSPGKRSETESCGRVRPRVRSLGGSVLVQL